MRRLLIGIAASTALLHGATRAGSNKEEATGFDHLDHRTKVAVSGAQDLPCDACHGLDRTGAPTRYDHATCFSNCHGVSPAEVRRASKVALQKSTACRVCHRAEQVATMAAKGRYRGRSGAIASDPEHAIRFPHDRHKATRCERCHADGAGKSVHSRCNDCHLSPRATAAMRDCRSCHVDQVGSRGPTLAPGRYSVASKFDHKGHDAVSKTGCLRCHANVPETKDDTIAAPAKAACAVCHDGVGAFSTLGPGCTRCHGAAQLGSMSWKRPAIFDHETHEQSCSTCHELDASTAPGYPANVHKSCASGRCHIDEFSSIKPTICSVCHVGSEPWRRLHVEPVDSPTRAQFTVRFDHALHQAGADTCGTCHSKSATPGAPTHLACTGEGCHRSTRGPEPTMTSCDRCHQARKALDTRETSERAWSVAAKFDHRRHDSDARSGAALPCESCHPAGKLDGTGRFAPPSKTSCQPCHDGTTAFKLTGHGCRRCHSSL